MRVIQVPCTGRVDLLHLLRAIEDGADGVYVAGCLEGECHYQTGNLKARRKVDYLKKLLAELGIEPGRVAMFNLASSEVPRFAQLAREFTAAIRALGPSPLRPPGPARGGGGGGGGGVANPVPEGGEP